MLVVAVGGCGGSKLTPEETKNTVLDFEKEMNRIDRNVVGLFKSQQTALQGLADGKVQYEDVYDVISDSYDVAMRSWDEIKKVKVREGLHADVAKQLEIYQTKLEQSIFAKAMALKASKEYLEEQDQNKLKEYNDQVNLSDSLVTEAIQSLMKAKETAGIE